MFAPRIAKAKLNSPATTSSPVSHPDISDHARLRQLAQHSSALDGGRKEQEAETAAHTVLNPSRKLSNITSSSILNMVEPPAEQPSGKSLDSSTANFMGTRFRHDFSKVRIHDDSEAQRAVSSVGARAFTLGQHIHFGAGQYVPGARSGMSLLAHELTHVVQEAGNPFPALRCAPPLSGHTTREILADEKIAGDVDAALKTSKAITAYIPKEQIKETKGHVHIDLKGAFEKHEEESAKASGNTSPPVPEGQTVAGFTDLRTGQIHLKNQLADVESAIHEAIHLNSNVGNQKKGLSAFQLNFGHPLEEGVTQYFTNKVLDEQGLAPGPSYKDELNLAQALIDTLGEKAVGDAYFKGDTKAQKAIVDASNKHGDMAQWRKLSRSDDSKDWPEAIKELKKIFP